MNGVKPTLFTFSGRTARSRCVLPPQKVKSVGLTPVVGLCVLVVCGVAGGGEVFDAEARGFAAKVDAGALELLPVVYRGRVAILDTVARDQLDQMLRSHRVEGVPAVVAWLEIYFRAGQYADRPLLHVREKNMRGFLAEHLDANTLPGFRAKRRIPPATLLDEEGWAALVRAGRAERDDIRRAGAIRSLRDALPLLSDRPEFRVPTDRLSVRYSAFMATAVLRVVPGPAGQWWALENVFAAAAAQTQPALPPIASKWLAIQRAWRGRDAAEVNRLAGEVGRAFATDKADRCPPALARTLERIYNRTEHATFALAGFCVSLVLLIVAAASGARWARGLGLAIFSLSTLILAGAFVARWIVSGRGWLLPPIMNQYEAVIGSAMLAAVLAVGLELASRRNYFAVAAGLYAAVSLLSGLLFPEQMDPGMKAQHGILASPVMAVHVAVIIIGHALVGMTFFLSLTYLGAVAVAGLGGPSARPSSPADLRGSEGLSTLAALDRCNLILAQLACWMVIAGTMLGAYWGDFAWGRWWGWDPKETWALITCLVYIAVLHVRFVTPPRSRGLVTAIICLLGCLVMLFNWIGVNFFLAGKHSYA